MKPLSRYRHSSTPHSNSTTPQKETQNPASDPTKASKLRRCKLARDPIQGIMTMALDHTSHDNMVEVFHDGKILKHWNLEEVRNRAQPTA